MSWTLIIKQWCTSEKCFMYGWKLWKNYIFKIITFFLRQRQSKVCFWVESGFKYYASRWGSGSLILNGGWLQWVERGLYYAVSLQLLSISLERTSKLLILHPPWTHCCFKTIKILHLSKYKKIKNIQHEVACVRCSVVGIFLCLNYFKI